MGSPWSGCRAGTVQTRSPRRFWPSAAGSFRPVPRLRDDLWASPSVQRGVGRDRPEMQELGELARVDLSDDRLPEVPGSFPEDVVGQGGQGDPRIPVELAF